MATIEESLPPSCISSFYPEPAVKDFHIDLPVLLLPIEYALRKAQSDQLKSADRDVLDGFARIEDENTRKSALHAQHVQSVQEVMNKQRTMGTWEKAAQIISCLAALFAFGVGALAIAAGAIPAGVMMMVAGGVLLANQLVEAVSGWPRLAKFLAKGDEKLEERILWHLKLWTTLGTLVFSIVSTCVGGFAVLPQVVKIIGAILQGSIAVASGVTSIGKGIADRSRLLAEAKSKLFEKDLTLSSNKVKRITEFNETAIRRSKELTDMIRRNMRTERDIIRVLIKA